MRKAVWAAITILAVVGVDVVAANLPGPVPTNTAISNVESSSSFKQVVGNSTYAYLGYSNDPSYATSCVAGGLFHLLNPVHEYLTTTLMFSVQPTYTQPAESSDGVAPAAFNLFVEVNPDSGQIVSLQTEPFCA